MSTLHENSNEERAKKNYDGAIISKFDIFRPHWKLSNKESFDN